MKTTELSFADLCALMTHLADIGNDEDALLVAKEIDRRIEKIDFTFDAREVGSSVSTEDIIEMIDEELEQLRTVVTHSPTVNIVQNTLRNLRSRITAKEKEK